MLLFNYQNQKSVEVSISSYIADISAYSKMFFSSTAGKRSTFSKYF